MDPDMKPLDSFKLTGHVRANFACSYSEDDRFSVLYDGGVYVIALKANLGSDYQSFGCKKSVVKPTRYSACENVDMDINDFLYQLPKDDLYWGVLQSDLSSNLRNAQAVEPVPRAAQWSPKGLMQKSTCLLTVLTNLHSLELYAAYVDENMITRYRLVLNLTEQIAEREKSAYKNAAKIPTPNAKFAEYKRRVERVAPSAFCWSHSFTLENKPCAVLFTGHFDGSVSVWRITEVDSNKWTAECRFLERHSTNLGIISAMYWHQSKEFGGALCLGDKSGKLTIVRVDQLNGNDKAFIDKEVQLWTKTDVAVEKILVTGFENCTFIIVVKQCHLLFFGLDVRGNVFDFATHDVENFYVSGVNCFGNTLYVLTFTGVFKIVKIAVRLQNISVEETCVPLKLDSKLFRAHGLLVSPNRVFVGVVSHPFHQKHLTAVKQFVNVHLFHDSNIKPLKLLLDNPSDSLARFWDCFEVLRLTCLKEQRFPWLGLDPNLNYDTLSLVQLKTLRQLARISETVFNVVPKIINYDIKPYILLHHLVEIKLIVIRLNKLLTRWKELNTFQMRSVFLQNFYLKGVVVGGILAKAGVGSTFIKEIGHIMSIANELEYPEMMQCRFCGERILGPICVPPHADLRCCLSMMPIFMVPAYRCPLCGSMAHQEMEKEYSPVCCPYCDVSMDKIYVGEDLERALDECDKKFDGGVVKSVCFDDCLTDAGVEEALENDIEYAAISDCDSESEDLRDIYLKLSNVQLEPS